jgi:leucyl aminopeptidase
VVRLPELSAASAIDEHGDPDTLVMGVFRGGIGGPGVDPLLHDLGLSDVPRSSAFRGKLGEIQVLATPGSSFSRVALVGLGRMDELDEEQLRRAGGAATRALVDSASHIATTLALVNPSPAALRALGEGLLLGAHRDDRYRSKPSPYRLERITVVVPSGVVDDAAQQFEAAAVHALAQCRTRELVTTPAADMGPDDVVAWAEQQLPDSIQLEIWDEERLAAERCEGILAVGRGSARPPRLLVARYTPDNPVATIALVGKGILFDSGGLSLKPSESMETMKDDMGGAATVLGVMSVLPDLAPTVAVTGYCALAENMPSGDAQRPGDVFTARNGKTVQVLNTDAEGRLVLADALSVAAESEADAIVDIATLTGAVSQAVGRRATGIFGNDDDLLRQLLAAAEAAGEPTWHLPLWDDLRENLESDVADLDNISRADAGGATIAGLFLREFVADVPWAHLDIAGSAWGKTARGHLPLQGTGVGVRTILRWLESSQV